MEKCNTTLNFDAGSKQNIVGYYQNGNKNYTVHGDAVTTVSVDGATPTIKTVSLDNPSVTVNGTNGATVKATATSAKGTDLTKNVAWTVSGGNGVSIDKDTGVITVANNAAAGSYTVTASGKGNTSTGSADAKLTVTREAAKAKTVTISGGVDSLDIPITGTVDTTFTAAVTDQYGDAMVSEIEWSISPEITGVSMADGKVTVSADAKNAITDSRAFTVTAKSGSVTDSKTINVKREKSVTKRLSIAYADSATVPADGGKTAGATPAVTAYDQYDVETNMGDDINEREKITWSIAPQVEGVLIADDGTINIKNSAKAAIKDTTGIVFTVTAEYGDAKATREITIKRSLPVATTIKMYKNGTELTGATDTVVVPTTDTANEYIYTAKAFDQYGEELTGTNVAVSIAPASGEGVTVVGNKLIVSKGAKKDVSYTVTAALDENSKQTITVTVKDIDITWPTVTAKSGTYGQKWSEIVKFNGGSAVLNGKNVAGTFTLVNADSIPNVGDKYQFVFKSNDGQYTVTSAKADAVIAKASLTITAKNATVAYGEAPANNGVEYAGFVTGDESTNSLTGNLTYTYGDYAAGKDAGTYPIVPAGVEAENYEITFKNGTLTVSPKALPADAIAAIDAVTYNGKAQAPALNVVDGTKVLTTGTDYTAVYSNNTNAGTAKVVITGKGNYSGTAEQTFTINKKPVTVTSGITAKDREYNSTNVVELDCTKAVFDGLIAGDNLTVAATGAMADAHAGSNKKVTISGLTLDGTSAGNYVLAENGNQTTTTVNISKQAATALTLTAKNAVYTAAAYDAKNVTPSRNANDVHLTYYADDNGKQGAEINAPVNVGTYWVSGKINETEDISAAVAAAVKFQITKAPLTVTANNNTITYGAEPAANGYTVSGQLGSDTESVVSDVEYAYSYKQYGNVGAYDITPKDAKAANYEIKFVSGELTVEPKAVTVSGITAKNRQYNGETAVELDCTKAVFGGVVNNDALTVAAVGTMATADAAQGKEVSISDLKLGGASAGNYVLAETGHQTTTTVNISKKTATELTLTAKNAAYTGVAYDATNVVPSRDAKDVVLTYYADNNGQQGGVLTAAPTAVGTYWVSGKIEETNNIAAAVAAAVKFQITKAPLTITAKDKTITYGDAPANDGAKFEGLVNNESAETVVSDLTYAYNYERYGNVGAYTITPKDAKAGNYDIKFVSGKLTVSPKTVGLEWTGAGTLYYDGKAKNVAAVAIGLVNDDKIAVTVSGGTQTAIGSYSAAATGLTGAKAGNYTLPENKTAPYTIEAALTSVTVTPATITATIDGLTIKLVGYKTATEVVEISADGATVDGNKLTINGVEYTIDKSGVKDMPAEVEIQPEESEVASASTELPQEEQDKLNEINDANTKGEGLNEAAADKIAAADKTITEQDKTENEVTKVQVKITLNIQPKSFEEKEGKHELTLNIEPKITYTYVNKDGDVVTKLTKTDKLANNDIKAPVTISVKLPNGFIPNFAKHHNEMIPVTVDNSGVATWQQSSFSDVTLVSDTRAAVLTFQFEDGHTQTITYTAADIGKEFPRDSKSGFTFKGWSDGTDTYTSLTDAALTALNGTKTLTGSFTQKSNTGSGSSSGGSAVSSTYVITAKAGNGGTISPNGSVSVTGGKDQSFAIKANDGYKIEDVLVDGKSVGAVASYKFTKVKAKHTIEARFAKTEDVTPSTGFTDVKTTDYFFNAVDWAVKNNITNGLTSTTFGPDVTCTRAQTVTFLWRAAGSPAPKTANNPFTDVKASDYYYNAVLWAVENGITNGASATTFAPDATVERGQVVTFLWRAADKLASQADNHFTDLKDGAYYTDAVLWAVEKGITTGTSATTFAPEAGCTRGQIVTFLYRAAQ
ncbi:MBG domain-containing protein [uncultured Agathobaculum sp.]|uniref:MBG domain-containing protein n=1 Tax=uncultured Agathobaculum sp. TaxID=2048140 RepID=UPI00296EFE0F